MENGTGLIESIIGFIHDVWFRDYILTAGSIWYRRM